MKYTAKDLIDFEKLDDLEKKVAKEFFKGDTPDHTKVNYLRTDIYGLCWATPLPDGQIAVTPLGRWAPQ